jgi:TonB family protein
MIIRSIAALSLIALSTLSNQASAATSAAAPTRLANAECEAPAYRNSWQDDELSGNVKLAVLVDASGNVQQTKVISSSGHVALDKASLRASTACKFQPASNGSAPVWAQVQYKWVLN